MIWRAGVTGIKETHSLDAAVGIELRASCELGKYSFKKGRVSVIEGTAREDQAYTGKGLRHYPHLVPVSHTAILLMSIYSGVWEKESYSIDEASHELTTLLPQSPKHPNPRHSKGYSFIWFLVCFCFDFCFSFWFFRDRVSQ